MYYATALLCSIYLGVQLTLLPILVWYLAKINRAVEKLEAERERTS